VTSDGSVIPVVPWRTVASRTPLQDPGISTSYDNRMTHEYDVPTSESITHTVGSLSGVIDRELNLPVCEHNAYQSKVAVNFDLLTIFLVRLPFRDPVD
jgi:hypothetical protein